MNQKTISEMTKEVVKIFRKYSTTGTNPWTYKTAVQDLSYQVGSLTKLMLQLSHDRYAEGKSEEEIKAGISDELADIMAEVLFIAHQLDIDIHAAWAAMLKSDETKIKDRHTTSL